MLEFFGKRQQALLKLLLQNKAGLSMDELACELGITRSAVRQHLLALETGGFVAQGEERRTAGRPGHAYVLTGRGADLFPKQYGWFSGLLLRTIKAERGSEGLAQWLREMAGTIAHNLRGRLEGKGEPERFAEIARIMNELSYEAKVVGAPEGPVIEACNCVFHDLAVEYPEVCQFDLELLSELTGRELKQSECLLRGGRTCRFKLESQPGGSAHVGAQPTPATR